MMSANVVKPQQSPYYARIPWIMEIRKEFVLPGTRKKKKKKKWIRLVKLALEFGASHAKWFSVLWMLNATSIEIPFENGFRWNRKYFHSKSFLTYLKPSVFARRQHWCHTNLQGTHIPADGAHTHTCTLQPTQPIFIFFLLSHPKSTKSGKY